MEEEKRKIYTVLAFVAVVVLLLSCLVAAVVGGMAGFLVGQKQGRTAVEQALERRMEELLPELRLEVTPVPPLERRPLLLMRGALIEKVVPDSPADKAGLEEGDIILAIDDVTIGPGYPLSKAINRYDPNDRVTIRLWREGHEETVPVTLGQDPNNPGKAYLGVYYQMIVRPEILTPED